MIEVQIGGLPGERVDCVLRPVSSDAEPVSRASRDLGILAGVDVLEELERHGDLPAGAAVVTSPGGLACELLIHVVVQTRTEPTGRQVVERAFLNGLRRAAALGFRSLATPALGTGATHLDPETAARAMFAAARGHRVESALPDRIVVHVDSEYEREVFSRIMAEEAHAS